MARRLPVQVQEETLTSPAKRRRGASKADEKPMITRVQERLGPLIHSFDNHEEWSPQFFQVLRETGNVGIALKEVRVHRKVAYHLRKIDEDFAQEWEDALEESIQGLEARARERAMSYSDSLMMFLLKAHRPDVYGDRVRVVNEDELINRIRDLAAQHGLEPEAVLEFAKVLANTPGPGVIDVQPVSVS